VGLTLVPRGSDGKDARPLTSKGASLRAPGAGMTGREMKNRFLSPLFAARLGPRNWRITSQKRGRKHTKCEFLESMWNVELANGELKSTHKIKPRLANQTHKKLPVFGFFGFLRSSGEFEKSL
jgi:hypothetical protein